MRNAFTAAAASVASVATSVANRNMGLRLSKEEGMVSDGDVHHQHHHLHRTPIGPSTSSGQHSPDDIISIMSAPTPSSMHGGIIAAGGSGQLKNHHVRQASVRSRAAHPMPDSGELDKRFNKVLVSLWWAGECFVGGWFLANRYTTVLSVCILNVRGLARCICRAYSSTLLRTMTLCVRINKHETSA